ncbi:MAG: methenyltetrahydromethanopterin cyclohydrolase [Candidatus Methanoperedens sp.]|nr:methenyltetrahydromethanopterin cyclohydrolase [Candidatus Methanoperedens sp.]
MISVNETGLSVFNEMLDFANEMNVEIHEQKNGSTVIDAGVDVAGGYEAGLYLSRICLADLADLEYTTFDLGRIMVPAIRVSTDHPVVACMASQYAGWRISVGKYFAMGSGPARAISLNPKKLYAQINYKDSYSDAVIVLESDKLPPEEVTEKIAKDCDVDPSNLHIVVAPTASIAGSVQISARIVETGIHKMESIGFDINTIKSGYGIAPISPIVGDSTKCMGSTNDCIIYCGKTYYNVKYDVDKVKELIVKVPSGTSSSYGKPFFTTFKEAGFDFFKVDAGVFAPAEITINELNSARTFTSGKIDQEVLMKSFGISRL